jgi:hypothetical protein
MTSLCECYKVQRQTSGDRKVTELVGLVWALGVVSSLSVGIWPGHIATWKVATTGARTQRIILEEALGFVSETVI